MAATSHLDHRDFGPLYNSESGKLILGSFPSVKSREARFYYGHPQNRFWRIIRALDDPAVMEEAMAGKPVLLPAEAAGLPVDRRHMALDIEEDIRLKTQLILRHHLALWDTIDSCTITGSQDASIRDVTVSNFPDLMSKCSIGNIYCNGAASYRLFMKYAFPSVEAYCQSTGCPVPKILSLPSTSPANAAWTLPKLIEAWKCILVDPR